MKINNGKTNIKNFLNLGLASLICTTMNMAQPAHALTKEEEDLQARLLAQGEQTNTTAVPDASPSSNSGRKEFEPLKLGRSEAELKALIPYGPSEQEVENRKVKRAEEARQARAEQQKANQEALNKDKARKTAEEAKQSKALVPYVEPSEQVVDALSRKEAQARAEQQKANQEALNKDKTRIEEARRAGLAEREQSEQEAASDAQASRQARRKAARDEAASRAAERKARQVRSLEAQINTLNDQIKAEERSGTSSLNRPQLDKQLTDLYDQLLNLDADKSRQLRSDLNKGLEAARQADTEARNLVSADRQAKRAEEARLKEEKKATAAEELARQAAQKKADVEASNKKADADLAQLKTDVADLSGKLHGLRNQIDELNERGGSQAEKDALFKELESKESEHNDKRAALNRVEKEASSREAAAKDASDATDAARRAEKAAKRRAAAARLAAQKAADRRAEAEKLAADAARRANETLSTSPTPTPTPTPTTSPTTGPTPRPTAGPTPTGRAKQEMKPMQVPPRKSFGDRIKEIFSSKKANISKPESKTTSGSGIRRKVTKDKAQAEAAE